MSTNHVVTCEVIGPWSLTTSRRFWEGFTPASLTTQGQDETLRTVFRCDRDWARVEAAVTQTEDRAVIEVSGDGDLDAAAEQVARFLSLDVDATDWPAVGLRDPVIGSAQQALPGLRPCGFHSPYEAAVWAVISQRIRIVQASALRNRLIADHGEDGAFPSPETLLNLDLDLPRRKPEYLKAVAQAALDGILDGEALRKIAPEAAVARVREIKGLGPFASELVIIRGANAPDAVPSHERRLDEEISYQYGGQHTLADVSQNWRPFRTWAAVHLRTLREERTHEISGRRPA